MTPQPEFIDIRISSSTELNTYFHLLGDNYIYRGQSDHTWNLSTSLERTVDVALDRHYYEINSAREFDRRSHLFTNERTSGPESDLVERMALMQHHGIPTRLLDFTRSPYIATFFALSSHLVNRPDPHGTGEPLDAAVWAIHKDWIKLCRRRLLDTADITLGDDEKTPLPRHRPSVASLYCLSDEGCEEEGTPPTEVTASHAGLHEKRRAIKYFKQLMQSAAPPGELTPGLLLLTPGSLNARIMAQQGLFLVPVDTNRSFMENLLHMFRLAEPPASCRNMPIIKFRIPQYLHRRITSRLTLMNVTGFSLFPDMQGLSYWIRTLPSINHERKRDRMSLEPLIRSNIKTDVTVPNKVGSLAAILRTFTPWELNVEHCFIIGSTAKVHKWTFDGSISRKTRGFRQMVIDHLRSYASWDALRLVIEESFRVDERMLAARSRLGYDLDCPAQVSACNRAYLALVKRVYVIAYHEAAAPHYVAKAMARIYAGVLTNRDQQEVLYDLARLFIKLDLHYAACSEYLRTRCGMRCDPSPVCGDTRVRPVVVQRVKKRKVFRRDG